MGYCRAIAGECPASNNALKCAKTECPHAEKKEAAEEPEASHDDD